MGEDPFQEVINLADLIAIETDQAWYCGAISYKLANETLYSFIEVDSAGSVFVDPMSPDIDSDMWIRLHEITFEAYFNEIDPDQRSTFLLADVILQVQLSLPLSEEE